MGNLVRSDLEESGEEERVEKMDRYSSVVDFNQQCNKLKERGRGVSFFKIDFAYVCVYNTNRS